MTAIALTQGKVALVDDADVAALAAHKWHAVHINGYWYAATRIGKKTVTMHVFLMNPPSGKDVDHWNRDGLDNRRENMRICTRSQNLANQERKSARKTSLYKGVCRIPGGRWQTQLYKDGQRFDVGRFDTEQEAALAYNAAAVKFFGEFARLNDIQADAAL